MRMPAFILLMSVLAAPAVAQASDAPAKAAPKNDFAAMSVFIVANTNCGDLNFDVEKLKSALNDSAAQMHWSERKRRREASDMVELNKRRLEADPAAFCAAARSMAAQYRAAGLRF